MKRLLSESRLETVGLLFAFAAVALMLRIGGSYDAVFGSAFVNFIETDAWYHMRLVDAMIRHFPHRIWFDPYLVYPEGEAVNAGPFLDWVIAGVALLVGRGTPSSHLVDVVGAYTPAVMGALLPLPVYVLGRELFSRRAGLWAAAIVGILPGQILLRSRLGFADHHCAEVLLSTTALMCLVLALEPTRQMRTRLWMSAVAGAVLGLYLLTWAGGSLFVAIITASLAVTLVQAKVRGEAADQLPLLVAPAFAIAALMVAPWAATRPYFVYDIAALAGSVLLLIALRGWGRVTPAHRTGVMQYSVGLGLTAALLLAALYMDQEMWSGLATELARLSPTRSTGYVSEAVPLLKSGDRYPFPLWNEFSACLFLALLGCVSYLIRAASKRPKGVLVLFWTITIIGTTFGQVRFAYYLGVNVALFAGLACDEVLSFVEARGWRRRRPGSTATTGSGGQRSASQFAQWAAVLAVILVIAVPVSTRIRADWGPADALSADWYDALTWLKSRTPEPFGAADAYYRTDLATRVDSAGAYGILALWDYGYWIIRLGRRIPNTNPRQTQVKEVASFLLSETPAEAAAVLDALRSRYVVVDAMLQAKIVDQGGVFASIAHAGGRRPTDYCEAFEMPGDKPQVQTKLYCFPEYYRTMIVRLHVFGGRAAVPSSVTAISWADQVGDRPLRRLVGQSTFGTYEEAERFIAERPSERWRIASADPLVTCVPLETLGDYAPVFRSIGRQGTRTRAVAPPVVQIYEYLRFDHR